MITKAQAVALEYQDEIHHVRLRNADGSPLRARVNGRTKTWKTRPDEFKVPMKHGLYECFYLDQTNAHEWCLGDGRE